MGRRRGGWSVDRRRRSRMPFVVVFRRPVGSRRELRGPNKIETVASHQSPSRDRYARVCRLPNGQCRFSRGVVAFVGRVMCRPASFRRASQKLHSTGYGDFLGYHSYKQGSHSPMREHLRLCRYPTKSAFQRCRSYAAVFSREALVVLRIAMRNVERFSNVLIGDSGEGN